MKHNDRVTVLVDGLLVHGRWGAQRGHRSFAGVTEDLYTINRRGIGGLTHTSWVTMSDEGKVWVRGHVDENDPAGAALLTVHALRPRRRRRRLLDPRDYDTADLEWLFANA